MSHVNLDREFRLELAAMRLAASKEGGTIRADTKRLIIYWIDPDGSMDICWSAEQAMALEFDDGSYQ